MNWIKFDEENNFSQILSKLARKFIEMVIEDLEDGNTIIAFGSYLDAVYGDINISILTKYGESNVPDWYREWGWISAWDYQGELDNNPAIEHLRKILSTPGTHFEDDFLEEFMLALIKVLVNIRDSTEKLKQAKLILIDHDEPQSKSEERLRKIIKNDEFDDDFLRQYSIKL